MTNTLTPAVSTLWKLADKMQVGKMYDTATRNHVDSIRAQFKADREVVGTRAWAICQCMMLRSFPAFTDEHCAAITAALQA